MKRFIFVLVSLGILGCGNLDGSRSLHEGSPQLPPGELAADSMPITPTDEAPVPESPQFEGQIKTPMSLSPGA